MLNDESRQQDALALETAEHCPLSEEARAVLAPDLTSEQYLARLISGEQYSDAIRFAAYCLPKRDAVWWGTLCLWEAYRTEAEEPIEASVHAVFESLIAWIQDPNETNRRMVETAGRDAGITTPPGQLAMAAFFSEGSISLPGQPEVEPKPWYTAKNVASSVLAASKINRPTDPTTSQRAFLVLVAEQGEGKLPWNLSEKPPVEATSSAE